MSKENELHLVVVKFLTTHRSTQETFDFFNNVKNMELGGAIHSVQKNPDGWYTFDHIIAGKSKMKHTANQEFKILDHIFQGAGLEWNVHIRSCCCVRLFHDRFFCILIHSFPSLLAWQKASLDLALLLIR
jgi:hypothetical protein